MTFHKYVLLALGITVLGQSGLFAQNQIDTTGIYGEKADTLNATVFTAAGQGNFLSKGRDIRTEIISASGLCKMACCNVAESFENSASVTVGYSDAITGARQIRLLGQNGIYTQMLDENRPVMRGLSAPFGLNYIPGQWLESIQIAKGVTSVINGVESMTGQINMVHRSTTDEKPLFVQASIMDDTKADLNIISSLQLDDEQKWSTVILAHVDGNFKEFDHNSDGFMDDPRQLQFNLSNRWLYFSPTGVRINFGVKALRDNRTGGQMPDVSDPWRSEIVNQNLGGYFKVGAPLNDANTSSIAFIADYTYQDLQSKFGHIEPASIRGFNSYDAGQHSAFANFIYQNQDNESHHFTLGISDTIDGYDEAVFGVSRRTVLNDLGVYGEYTYHSGDVFSAIVGLRGDWYNLSGIKFSPRLTLKWTPAEWLVLRANGGRGLRYSTPLIDNFGVFSTTKTISGDYLSHPLEDSWTFGGNATWYIGKSGSTYLSFDYFHTSFTEQMLVDNVRDAIMLYTLSSLGGGYSYTNNYQLDFSIEPLPRFTITLTGRYTDARQTLRNQPSSIKPMTSMYKGVLNMQYATNLNRWIFDVTASVNGPCRVWDFMRRVDDMYADGYSPVYPLLFAQVTKRFKGFDIYAGGENLTNFRQKNPIIGIDRMDSGEFDASCVWGPIMGVKIYAGVRITVWKKEK